MARHAKILYQFPDAGGWLWDVREERPTSHGFSLLFGWPFGVPRGRGGSGGPALIPTVELVAHMEIYRANPGAIDLPCAKGPITRLRALLGHHRYGDRAKWWEDRIGDLMRLSGRKFIAIHGNCTESSASLWRRRLGGDRRARQEDWWREPRALQLLQSNMSTYAIAHILHISTSLAWSGKQRAIAPGEAG